MSNLEDRLGDRAAAAAYDAEMADARAAERRDEAWRALQSKIVSAQRARDAERARVAEIEERTEKRLAQIDARKKAAAEERRAFHDGVKQRAADRARYERYLTDRAISDGKPFTLS